MPQRTPEDVALRALRAADRSRAELDARLERQGIAGGDRRRVLDRLEEMGYVDDVRTASARALRLAERGYGDEYIRADLSQRGLPSEEAIAALDPEHERAARFAAKGLTWLARRGFAIEG